MGFVCNAGTGSVQRLDCSNACCLEGIPLILQTRLRCLIDFERAGSGSFLALRLLGGRRI